MPNPNIVPIHSASHLADPKLCELARGKIYKTLFKLLLLRLRIHSETYPYLLLPVNFEQSNYDTTTIILTSVQYITCIQDY